MKKIISIVLMALLVLSMVPAVFAENDTSTDTGSNTTDDTTGTDDADSGSTDDTNAQNLPSSFKVSAVKLYHIRRLN